jgi:serine/threonine protein kinase
VPEQFGSYVVGDKLGVGGMAIVHLAESRSAGGFRKRVALKRLLPHALASEQLVASFVEEAKLARYLNHPNIARIYDFGQIDDVYYIAFEFVAGPTLQQLARQCNACVGPIPTAVVLAIAAQICDALDHAHNLNDEHGRALHIVHRDVSPPNLIVASDGLVKLIDFGLAKAKHTSVQTQAGVVKGKLSYIAPEYLRGKLDHRCDLWAVGVVVHELLAGKRLFDADNDLATLDRVRDMPVRPPSKSNPDVPPDLDDIVMTALQRDPDRRWQSAVAMRNALVGVAAQLQPITNAQLIDWIEWAFMQKQKPHEHSVSALIAILERPSTPAPLTEEDLSASRPAIAAAMLERRTPVPELIAPAAEGARAEPIRPTYPRRSSLPWIVAFVVLAACAAAVIALYGLPEW